MADLIICGPSTNPGEVKLLHHLRDRLPVRWVVLGNPIIPGRKYSPEIDAIVIGDGYVWVIDGKSFSGRITGDEFKWILSNGSSRKNPMDTAIRAAKIVAGRINEREASEIWVQELIVMTTDGYSIQVQDHRIAKTVYPLVGIEEVLMQARYHRPAATITDERRHEIVRKLAGDEAVKQIGRSAETVTGIEIRLVVQLRLCGEYDFQRTYYSDEVKSLLLDRVELRGSDPPEVWKNMREGGVMVTFLQETVHLEVVKILNPVRLNGRIIAPGHGATLTTSTGVLQIADLRLTYSIHKELPS